MSLINAPQAMAAPAIPACDKWETLANGVNATSFPVTVDTGTFTRSGKTWNSKVTVSYADGYQFIATSADGKSTWSTNPQGGWNGFPTVTVQKCVTTANTTLLHMEVQGNGNYFMPEDMYIEVRSEGPRFYYPNPSSQNFIGFAGSEDINSAMPKDAAGNPHISGSDRTPNENFPVAPSGYEISFIADGGTVEYCNSDNQHYACLNRTQPGISQVDIYAYSSNHERILNLNANNGQWVDGAKTKYQVIDTNNTAVTDDRPTRDGYILDSWNTKPDGTGDNAATLRTGLKDGQMVYAIWRKDPGKPTHATIDCSMRKGAGALCAIQAFYADAPMQTREIATNGTDQLSWNNNPISGVNLDRNGYAGDASCTVRGDGDSQCYYVSLAEAPAATPNSYVAQTPQTGDPAVSIRQQAGYVIALLAVGIAAAVAVVGRKKSV